MLPLDDGCASASRPSIAAPNRRPVRGCRRSTNWSNWSNWSIAAATIRCGSATTSRSPCRSSIRCCNSPRRRWSSRRLTLGHLGLSAAAAPSRAGGEAGRHPGSPHRGPPDLRRRRRRRVPARIRGVRHAARRTRRAAQRSHPAAAPVLERRTGQPHRPLLWPVHRRPDAAAGAPARRPADLVRRPLRWRAAPHRAAGRWLALLCRDARDVSRVAGQDRCRGERGGTQPDRLRHRPSAVHPHRRQLRTRHSTPRPKRSACAMQWTSAAPPSAIARSGAPSRWPNASANSMPPACGTSCSICSGHTSSGTNRSRASPPRRCRCCAICCSRGTS